MSLCPAEDLALDCTRIAVFKTRLKEKSPAFIFTYDADVAQIPVRNSVGGKIDAGAEPAIAAEPKRSPGCGSFSVPFIRCPFKDGNHASIAAVVLLLHEEWRVNGLDPRGFPNCVLVLVFQQAIFAAGLRCILDKTATSTKHGQRCHYGLLKEKRNADVQLSVGSAMLAQRGFSIDGRVRISIHARAICVTAMRLARLNANNIHLSAKSIAAPTGAKFLLDGFWVVGLCDLFDQSRRDAIDDRFIVLDAFEFANHDLAHLLA
jgi:hypothetical protein